jgi:hypothetical protein
MINSGAPLPLYLTSSTQRNQCHKSLPNLISDKTFAREPNKVCYKFNPNLNHYFLTHENFNPLTLIKCNSFTPQHAQASAQPSPSCCGRWPYYLLGTPLHSVQYNSYYLFYKPHPFNLGDYTSIIPVADNPGFINWRPTTATGPQHRGTPLH